jgi:hypothetical protein
MAITSAARIKAFMGIPAGLTYHDTVLGYAATAADAVVLRALDQASLAVLTIQEYPEVFNAGQVSVLLKHAPVAGIVAITNDGAAIGATQYRLDSDVGQVTLMDGNGYWSQEREGAEVMYGYGYDSTTIPDDIVAAADFLGAFFFNRTKHLGFDSQGASGYSVSLSKAPIPPEVQAILSRYQDVHR